MSGHKPSKRRIAVTCPECQKSTQVNPAALLEIAARALTACHNAGLDIKIKHGILSCEEGFLLQLDDGSFIARTRTYSEFSRKAAEAEDADS